MDRTKLDLEDIRKWVDTALKEGWHRRRNTVLPGFVMPDEIVVHEEMQNRTSPGWSFLQHPTCRNRWIEFVKFMSMTDDVRDLFVESDGCGTVTFDLNKVARWLNEIDKLLSLLCALILYCGSWLLFGISRGETSGIDVVIVGRVYRRVVLGVPMRQGWAEDIEGQYPRSRYPRGYEMQNLRRRE
jgi:hypothetical protein